MDVDCLSFRQTGYFSDLICDYIAAEKDVRPFYNRYPNLESFKDQIKEKSASFPEGHRTVLYDALHEQYDGFSVSDKTKANLRRLKEPITFTVTTGHQLNLFTGPLYFLYKIVSTINLTVELKKAYPKFNFVPVYWMATEDHDFEEINFFNFKNKKLQWNKNTSGAVGRLATEGLQEVFDTFATEIGQSERANYLKTLFRKSYLEHQNLADATRYLANALFGDYGLVIVDGDHKKLKNLLVPYAKEDIFENRAFHEVSETITRLKALPGTYNIQVNPREINYFLFKRCHSGTHCCQRG